jgi:hypothetical protein
MTSAEYRACAATQNKYGAVKTAVDGITFDSKAEATRYCELKLLTAAGHIYGLELQPVYEIVPKSGTERAVRYIADFRYVETLTGATVVEDVKGKRTRDYVIKRKLFKAKYPDIAFREVAR